MKASRAQGTKSDRLDVNVGSSCSVIDIRGFMQSAVRDGFAHGGAGAFGKQIAPARARKFTC